MDAASRQFTEEELNRLRALRRAAADINRSSLMRDSWQLPAAAHDSRLRAGPDEERFRSFIIGLRRTYAQKDAANFRTVVQILARRAPELRGYIEELKQAYNSTLTGTVAVNSLTREQVFDCWLYGYLIHDDNATKRARWEAIARSPTFLRRAQITIQATAIAMADIVIALDGLIADLLGEPQLPPALPPRDTYSRALDLQVSIRSHGRRGDVVVDFVNVGPGEIRNIALDKFTALSPGNEAALYSGQVELVFPVPRLRPKERVSMLAGPTHGTPRMWEAVLSWDNPAGERMTDDYLIDFIALSVR